MIPVGRIVLNAPEWLVVAMLVAVIVAALMRVVIDLYVVHVRIDDYERVADDADRGARGVARHDDELEEIRVYLAARDDGDVVPADTVIGHPAATANVKAEALRPVPHKRAG